MVFIVKIKIKSIALGRQNENENERAEHMHGLLSVRAISTPTLHKTI